MDFEKMKKESGMAQPLDAKLTVRQLAEVMYEGTQHVENLAEKLARQHGNVKALTFFNMMPEYVQNFWISIAQKLIDFSALTFEQQEKFLIGLNPSEAVYGFASWLTVRKQSLTVGSMHDAAPVAQLVKEYCEAQQLPPVSENYPKNLIAMGTGDKSYEDNSPSIKEAMRVVSDAINYDPYYKQAWIANIAGAFVDIYKNQMLDKKYDYKEIADLADKAAERFISMLTHDQE